MQNLHKGASVQVRVEYFYKALDWVEGKRFTVWCDNDMDPRSDIGCGAEFVDEVETRAGNEKGKAIMSMKFEVEDTGGGCKWLRSGKWAITDGEYGVPCEREVCFLFELDREGQPVGDGVAMPSVKCAQAYAEHVERVYGRLSRAP